MAARVLRSQSSSGTGLGTRLPAGLPSMEVVDIQNDPDVPLRKRLAVFLATSGFGTALRLLDVLLSLTSLVLYVVEVETNYRTSVMVGMEIILVSFFCAYLALNLTIAPNPLRWATSPLAILSALSIIPIATISVTDDPSFVVRFVRLLRISRLAQFSVLFRFAHSEINYQLVSMGFTLLVITFTASAFVLLFETSDDIEPVQSLSFYESYYLIIMSITTVGYGDISPQTWAGRLTIMVMMAAALLTVPKQTNRLILLLSRRSDFTSHAYIPGRNTQFIVVTGALSSWSGSHSVLGMGGVGGGDVNTGSGVLPFFTEFFHDDHGGGDRHVVAISSGMPSKELRVLMSDPRYSLGVTYLDGDVMDEKDLERCSLELCKGVFILSNKFSCDTDAEDSSTIMRAVSMKRFVYYRTGRDLLTCVQLIRPENKQLFMSSTAPYALPPRVIRAPGSLVKRYVPPKGGLRHTRGTSSSLENLSVVMEEIKLNLFAKSCQCPGLTTMIFNLVSSASDEDVIPSSEDDDARWLAEYNSGAQYEMYRVPMSTALRGMTFTEAATCCFVELSVVLFAVEIGSSEVPNSCVVLNPGAFKLPTDQRFSLHMFVIASDKREAELVTTYGFSRIDSGKTSKFIRSPSRTHLLSEKPPMSAYQPGLPGQVLDDVAEGSERGRNSPADGGLGMSPPKSNASCPSPHSSQGTNVARASGSPSFHRPAASSGAEETKDSTAKEGNAFKRIPGTVELTSCSSVPPTVDPVTPRLSFADDPEDGPSARDTPSPVHAQTFSNIVQQARISAGEPLLIDTESGDVVVDSPILASTSECSETLVNHVIVAARGQTDIAVSLFHFIKPLRAPHLVEHLPVVVLAPTLPPESLCENLSLLGSVWFIQGSPLEAVDLHRAGVRDASSAVIFTSPTAAAEGQGDILLDADTICIYKLIRTRNPNIEVVCEIVDQSHIPFMHNEGRSDEVFTSPPFAAGHVLWPAMLDVLLAQAFYNPHIITILDRLVVGDKDDPVEWVKSNPCLSRLEGLQSSHLYLMPVPPKYVGGSYKTMVLGLLSERHMVSLGLRRGAHVSGTSIPGSAHARSRVPMSTSSGDGDSSSNGMPYVFTNPPGSCIVLGSDSVYVLGTKAPTASNSRHRLRQAVGRLHAASNMSFSQLRALGRRGSSLRRLVRSRRNTGVFTGSPAVSRPPSTDDEADDFPPLNAVLSGSPRFVGRAMRGSARSGAGARAGSASSVRRFRGIGVQARVSPAHAAGSGSIGSPSVVAVQIQETDSLDHSHGSPITPHPVQSSFADRPATPADLQQCIAAMNGVREDLHQVVSRLRVVEERSLSQAPVKP